MWGRPSKVEYFKYYMSASVNTQLYMLVPFLKFSDVLLDSKNLEIDESFVN